MLLKTHYQIPILRLRDRVQVDTVGILWSRDRVLVIIVLGIEI